MSSVSTFDDALLSAEPAGATEQVARFGALTPAVVVAGIWGVALVTWWLLGDPKWSPIHTSQAAIGADLFWTILAAIVTGFTFAHWPFNTIGQPVAGFLQVAVNLALAFLFVWLFTSVIGSWDPTFSRSAPGGAGYTATAFVVLIGFYAYAFAAASLGGYPFEREPGPSASLAQFFLAAFLTMVGVVWLIYPNFNAHLAATAPVALPHALGWVYSSIVVVILAAMLWENWPWAGIGNRHVRALAAFVTTLGGGFLLYLVLRVAVKALVPADITALPTFSADSEVAQLGVCFSLWGLTWGLVAGAWPKRYRTVANRVVRTLVVTVLAVATYVIFMRFLGTRVLHYPALKGHYGGNPLGWIDWVILVLLWYTGAFGSSYSTKARRLRPG
jgi:hypothetical protein